eukprot:scaffold54479_cov59-Attheya_sp.AAC.4
MKPPTKTKADHGAGVSERTRSAAKATPPTSTHNPPESTHAPYPPLRGETSDDAWTQKSKHIIPPSAVPITSSSKTRPASKTKKAAHKNGRTKNKNKNNNSFSALIDNDGDAIMPTTQASATILTPVVSKNQAAPSPSKSPLRKKLRAKTKTMTKNLKEAASADPMIEDPPTTTAKQTMDSALKNTASKLAKAAAKKERAAEKLKRREEKNARRAAQKVEKAERAADSNNAPIEHSDHNSPDNHSPDETSPDKDDSKSIDTQIKDNTFDDNDEETSKRTGPTKSKKLDNHNTTHHKAQTDPPVESNDDTLDGVPLEVPTASEEKNDNETDFHVDGDDEEEEEEEDEEEDEEDSTAVNEDEEEEDGKEGTEEEQLDNLDLPDEIHNAIYGDEDGDAYQSNDDDEFSILNIHTQWIFRFNNVPKSKDTDLTKLSKHQVLVSWLVGMCLDHIFDTSDVKLNTFSST